MKVIRSTLVLLALLAAVLLGLGSLGSTLRTAPDNAGVIVDMDEGVYASIPCVLVGTIDRELIKNRDDVSEPDAPLILSDYAETGTIGEARAKRWRPDVRCRNSDGFMRTVSLPDRVLGYQSRWTPGGEWRW